jgi:hypothetical protein
MTSDVAKKEELDFAAGLFDEVLAAHLGRRLPAMLDTRPVYFVQADGGPIKIGLAANPRRRVADLQTSSPYPLRLVATLPGQGAMGESALHAKFAHLRMHGEWFEPAPELLAYIEANGVPA